MKIACVGDSITAGVTASDPEKTSYPAWLMSSAIYGNAEHEVLNLGVSGSTMLKDGDLPYWEQDAYQSAIDSDADVFVIQLGTNDAKTYQWNEAKYIDDYNSMIESFASLRSPSPDIWISIPPPLYLDNIYDMNMTAINEGLPTIIPFINDENDSVTGVIDVFSALGGAELSKYEFFCNGQNCDQCHPNDMGYSVMAAEVYKALFMAGVGP
ncbi:hypothetical protein TL16_g08122 [Triparma laevis f. inornata]|uniref:SGNH hydrolase-type esterase domain-containing protein n=1 Tax=Triparma laevis f. inornata TaxID=1714386 RepID=A0A9W7EIQ0_9STRA|nr:hypothetical protein TL16_g08122 [Triparma laevis f. inornata]